MPPRGPLDLFSFVAATSVAHGQYRGQCEEWNGGSSVRMYRTTSIDTTETCVYVYMNIYMHKIVYIYTYMKTQYQHYTSTWVKYVYIYIHILNIYVYYIYIYTYMTHIFNSPYLTIAPAQQGEEPPWGSPTAISREFHQAARWCMIQWCLSV